MGLAKKPAQVDETRLQPNERNKGARLREVLSKTAGGRPSSDAEALAVNRTEGRSLGLMTG